MRKKKSKQQQVLDLPTQAMPSPVTSNPGGQVHLNPPSVFSQRPSRHIFGIVLHSSMSVVVRKKQSLNSVCMKYIIFWSSQIFISQVLQNFLICKCKKFKDVSEQEQCSKKKLSLQQCSKYHLNKFCHQEQADILWDMCKCKFLLCFGRFLYHTQQTVPDIHLCLWIRNQTISSTVAYRLIHYNQFSIYHCFQTLPSGKKRGEGGQGRIGEGALKENFNRMRWTTYHSLKMH